MNGLRGGVTDKLQITFNSSSPWASYVVIIGDVIYTNDSSISGTTIEVENGTNFTTYMSGTVGLATSGYKLTVYMLESDSILGSSKFVQTSTTTSQASVTGTLNESGTLVASIML